MIEIDYTHWAGASGSWRLVRKRYTSKFEWNREHATHLTVIAAIRLPQFSIIWARDARIQPLPSCNIIDSTIFAQLTVAATPVWTWFINALITIGVISDRICNWFASCRHKWVQKDNRIAENLDLCSCNRHTARWVATRGAYIQFCCQCNGKTGRKKLAGIVL